MPLSKRDLTRRPCFCERQINTWRIFSNPLQSWPPERPCFVRLACFWEEQGNLVPILHVRTPRTWVAWGWRWRRVRMKSVTKCQAFFRALLRCSGLCFKRMHTTGKPGEHACLHCKPDTRSSSTGSPVSLTKSVTLKAGAMSQWVEIRAVKANDLSSIPNIHMVERELIPKANCSLTYTCTLWHTDTHMHAHMHMHADVCAHTHTGVWNK